MLGPIDPVGPVADFEQALGVNRFPPIAAFLRL